jgi:hypothetical protein
MNDRHEERVGEQHARVLGMGEQGLKRYVADTSAQAMKSNNSSAE